MQQVDCAALVLWLILSAESHQMRVTGHRAAAALGLRRLLLGRPRLCGDLNIVTIKQCGERCISKKD
jgi:hypothetical protein